MHSDRLLMPTQSPFQWLLRTFSLRVNCWGMKLTTHLHQVPHLGFCGALPPLPFRMCVYIYIYIYIYRVRQKNDISEEPLVSIIIFFHPENGNRRLLHVVWYVCTELHAITSQKTVVLMSYYIYVFIKI